jgi:hypothetical protein
MTTLPPTWLDEVDTEAEAFYADVAAGVYPDEAIIQAPTGQLGWGSDLQGTGDITHDAKMRLGSDPMVVVEAIIRRINTGENELPPDDDPETAVYGIDEMGVCGWLNAGFNANQLADKARQLAAEIERDDRVESVRVTQRLIGTDELEISISGSIVAPDVTQPFDLTLAVTSADVLLKALHLPGATT